MLINFPNRRSWLGLRLFQMLPDSGRVNIFKIVAFFLGEKPVLFYQTGKVPLHLGPRQISPHLSLMAWDWISRKIVAIFVFQPFSRTLFTGMIGHVLLYPALTAHVPIPLLDSRVNIGLCNLPHWCRSGNRRCSSRHMYRGRLLLIGICNGLC